MYKADEFILQYSELLVVFIEAHVSHIEFRDME